MKVLQKAFWTDASDTIVSAGYGLQHFAEAAALVIVSSYTGYGAFHYAMGVLMQRVLIVAAAVIGLRGGYEFIRCLARQGKSDREQGGK